MDGWIWGWGGEGKGGETRKLGSGWRRRRGGVQRERENWEKKERNEHPAERGASSVLPEPLDHVPIGLFLSNTHTHKSTQHAHTHTLTQLLLFSLKPTPLLPSSSPPSHEKSVLAG